MRQQHTGTAGQTARAEPPVLARSTARHAGSVSPRTCTRLLPPLFLRDATDSVQKTASISARSFNLPF